MIRVRFNERQSDEFKVWLEPAARDWILVGIAEGTAAYNTHLRQHGNRQRRRSRRRLRAGWPRRLLRQGPHQGRLPADHGLRLGARESGGARSPARHHRTGSLLPAVRRQHRAALRGRLARASCISRSSGASSWRCSATSTPASRSPSSPATTAACRACAATTPASASRCRPSPRAPIRAWCRTSCAATAPPVSTTCRARPSSSAATSCASKCATASKSPAWSRAASCRASSTTTSTTNAARCSSRSRCRTATTSSTRIFIVVDYEVRTGGEDQTAAGLRVAAKFAEETRRDRRQRRARGCAGGRHRHCRLPT